MTIAPGRTPESRTMAGVSTTSSSSALSVSGDVFNKADIGRPVSGTGIPAGTTIVAVPTTTTATLSANATATGTIVLTVGRNAQTDAGYGFIGWSPESEAEAASYTIAGVTSGAVPPGRMTDNVTPVRHRRRS